MAELSPAAQAVLDEVLYRMSAGESDSYAKLIAAAALRAATDQAKLLPLDAAALTIEDMVEQRIRCKLLNIAAELENH